MEKREQLPQGMEEKLAVLEQIAHAFRKEKICWAVGGSLLPEQINEYLSLKGEVIPLQKLSLWKNYYALMDRQEKVKLLEQHGV